jgi:hypothetical protein
VKLSGGVAKVLVSGVLASGCGRGPSRGGEGQARHPAAPSGALVLPEVAGFEATAPVDGPSYVRRRYSRGRARIEVTLARMPMSSDAYAEWVRMSTASFPQAALEVPAGEANGFYQCGDGATPSCDLLIQLRAGFHLEIRGGGTSTRDDVDALAHGLRLRALAGD